METSNKPVNAIERLREFLAAVEPTGNVELIYTSALPPVVPARDALAAVDALYQAARHVVDVAAPKDAEGWIAVAEATVALAAAVRRVDGE